jgi:3-isopropylmalate dehydratase small subunit
MIEIKVIEIDTDEVIESRFVSAREADAIQKGYASDSFYRVEIG